MRIPRSDINRRANFRQIQRRVRVSFEKCFKACDDRIVASAAGGHSQVRAIGHAPDHHGDQILLEGPVTSVSSRRSGLVLPIWSATLWSLTNRAIRSGAGRTICLSGTR